VIAVFVALALAGEPDLLVPEDETAAAAKLVAAERAIRDPNATDWRLEGHVAQRIYRSCLDRPERGPKIVAAVPEDLRATVARNLAATLAIAKTARSGNTTVPGWTIAEPAPLDQLEAWYHEASDRFSVPWTILAAVHLIETRMGRLRGISVSGARGPMQFLPATWAGYGLGGDIDDEHDAILAAANYLAKMGASRDLDKAIWHYNNHDDYVQAVRGYAHTIDDDPLALRGFYGWEVYYRTVNGSILLAPGYHEKAAVPVATWCAGKGPPTCPADK
jgi:membrane-bound lytic murein transglycosylase B